MFLLGTFGRQNKNVAEILFSSFAKIFLTALHRIEAAIVCRTKFAIFSHSYLALVWKNKSRGRYYKGARVISHALGYYPSYWSVSCSNQLLSNWGMYLNILWGV